MLVAENSMTARESITLDTYDCWLSGVDELCLLDETHQNSTVSID